MMQFYFVKADLWGVPRGSVEKFSPEKAVTHLAEGSLEPFDAKKHAKARGAQAAIACAEAAAEYKRNPPRFSTAEERAAARKERIRKAVQAK